MVIKKLVGKFYGSGTKLQKSRREFFYNVCGVGIGGLFFSDKNSVIYYESNDSIFSLGYLLSYVMRRLGIMILSHRASNVIIHARVRGG